jgi:copper chaperone NosL
MQRDSSLRPRVRLALAVAALSLVAVYFFPIWQISLEAPQYPEGIGMEIWVNTVTGQEPGNLQSINGLNHYIGMKEIKPDAIPELKYMPWIIAVLIVLGLGAAWVNRRWALYAFAALFLLTAVAGMVDFYIWEYNYGHDLDPTAAIKIPGATYQPPLIGSKKMLNITAHSWPALGGIVMILSCATVCGGAVFEWWMGGETDEPMSKGEQKATAA